MPDAQLPNSSRGRMAYVRESAIQALDVFPGRTLSDRILAAANREVTDEMVERACNAYEAATEHQCFRPHAHLMKVALAAASSTRQGREQAS